MKKKNYLRLKVYFFSHGINLKEVQDVLGIGRTTLYNKLNGYHSFKTTEIEKLKETYNLTDYYF